MCHDHDAHPPEVPLDLRLARMAGGAGAELLELTSDDGTVFSAGLAESPDPKGPAVIVLPDVRGLYPFYMELAERFAGAGHHAMVLDYFGRTAGLGPRDEDFDWMTHVTQTKPEQVQADIAAIKDELRQRTGATEAVTVGFCFGGTQSFLAATNGELGLAGVVGFYGGLDTAWLNIASPRERGDEATCPVLGLFGGADTLIPQEQIDEFGAGLARAGVEHELITYPGAPHSFFDRSFEEHAEACEDAWRRVLGFLSGAAVPA
jgi:carboxymethylenebutenolidase